MIQSSKKKAHYGCQCTQCNYAAATKAGQKIHNLNERKLRRLNKRELDRAVKEAQHELEDVDVIPSLRSPRIG